VQNELLRHRRQYVLCHFRLFPRFAHIVTSLFCVVSVLSNISVITDITATTVLLSSLFSTTGARAI
jgi:hypothetical protein